MKVAITVRPANLRPFMTRCAAMALVTSPKLRMTLPTPEGAPGRGMMIWCIVPYCTKETAQVRYTEKAASFETDDTEKTLRVRVIGLPCEAHDNKQQRCPGSAEQSINTGLLLQGRLWVTIHTHMEVLLIQSAT